jgi:hypothetical protein
MLRRRRGTAPQWGSGDFPTLQEGKMVLPVRIELTTSALPITETLFLWLSPPFPEWVFWPNSVI